MTCKASAYREKLITPAQAAAMVKPGDTVDLYGYCTWGAALERALIKRKAELKNVKIRTMMKAGPGYEIFDADPKGEAFYSEGLFVGAQELKQLAPENRTAVPALFYNFPNLYRRGDLTADFGSLQVSPLDDDGYFHFSVTTAFAKGFATGVKCFIPEVNTNLFPLKNEHPDAKIHISEVDYVIEGENPALYEFPDPVPGEIDRMIADLIMKEMRDGCCLQIGLGKVPMALISLIADSDLKDLGVHTEFFADGLMRLHQAGKVTNRYKSRHRGQMTTCLAQGSAELYEFVRQCQDLYMGPVDYINDPYLIGQNDNVISINSCLEIDITGQVNCENIGTTQVAATGGQLDFILGAYRSQNGKSIICLPSSYKKKDGTTGSKILAVLGPGVGVSDPRSAVQYVCTEYGMVNIMGKNLWERAERLIGIAHPDFREELIKDAEKYGIWRRSNKR